MTTTDDIYLKGMKAIGKFLGCMDRRTTRSKLRVLGIEPKRVGREVWIHRDELRRRIDSYLAGGNGDGA